MQLSRQISGHQANDQIAIQIERVMDALDRLRVTIEELHPRNQRHQREDLDWLEEDVFPNAWVRKKADVIILTLYHIM